MAGRPSRTTRQSRPNYQENYHEQPRAKWTAPLTKILAEIMVEQAVKGNKQGNTYGKQAWNNICDGFQERTGLKWEEQQLKSRYIILKKQYVTVKSILSANDFSWDEAQQMVTATDQVWDNYLKTHPDAEIIRTNGCPLYKDLCIIFSEIPWTKQSFDRSNYPVEMEEDSKTAVMPMNFDAPTPVHQQEESSSSSDGEESIPVEKKSQQRNFGRKRNPEEVDNLMVKAILDMVTASKLRATAVMQSSDRFSITNCVKALDELVGVSDQLYYTALDLFDKPQLREMFMSLRTERRLVWLKGKCNAVSGFIMP